MIEIISGKLDEFARLYVFALENGDTIIIKENDIEMDIIHSSVKERNYLAVLNEDTKEIIGFKSISTE